MPVGSVVVWSGVPVVSVVSVLPADVDVLPFGVVVGADDVVGSAGPVVESFGSVLPAGDVDTLPQRISAS